RVADDASALAHERGREPEVRHVAGREKKRALAAREGCESLLERIVLALVAADEVRCTGAHTVLARSFHECRTHARMRGNAEVIVAAEVDAAPAVELDFGGVEREPANGAAPAAQPALVEIREYGRKGSGRCGHRVSSPRRQL